MQQSATPRPRNRPIRPLHLIVIALVAAAVSSAALLSLAGFAGTSAVSAEQQSSRVPPVNFSRTKRNLYRDHDAWNVRVETDSHPPAFAEQRETRRVAHSNEVNTNAAVIHCDLSRRASEANIWGRLHSRCTYCDASWRPRAGGRATPEFCVSASPPFPRPRFDFSHSPAAHSLFPQGGDVGLSVVYSALGQRFSGPGGQSYVVEAIRQWRLFHDTESSDIFLILDDNMTSIPDVVECVRAYRVQLVRRSEIMTRLWEQYANVFYVQGFMHPGGSRKTGHQHFNQLVSERFFALHGLMKLKGLTNVIHFENDNMVYGDMRPVVDAAERCGYRLASTFANHKHVIPGVLYIRDAMSIEALCQFIVSFLSCGETFGRKFTPRFKDYANDMTYMMTFYQLYGSRALGALPAWEHTQGENCIAELLWRSAAVDTTNGRSVDPVSVPPQRVKAIFDLGSFGQWYSFAVGKDRPPLHVAQGIKGRFLDATPPPLMSWANDTHGRRVPLWKGYHVLSLHVHAKNLAEFRSK